MKNALKVLEPNVLGRDFVIGDLHGSLSALNTLKFNLRFDELVDRMISVGDLVDRGPYSLGCLRLLTESWFYCVLANHEQMMIMSYLLTSAGRQWAENWENNGGAWGTKYLNDRTNQHPATAEMRELVSLADELPFLITIKMSDGTKFHVLHAELPTTGITDEDLSSPEKVRELATSFDGFNGDSFLWKRSIFAQHYNADLSNTEKLKRAALHLPPGMFSDKLSHIISGHTIVQHPLTIIGQTNIDTGAFASYGDDPAPCRALTCVELRTWKFYQATETEFRTVEPISINRPDTAAPHAAPA